MCLFDSTHISTMKSKEVVAVQKLLLTRKESIVSNSIFSGPLCIYLKFYPTYAIGWLYSTRKRKLRKLSPY